MAKDISSIFADVKERLAEESQRTGQPKVFPPVNPIEKVEGMCGYDIWSTDPLTQSWGGLNTPLITPGQLEKKLDTIFQAFKEGLLQSMPIPIFIIGPPGIGKTDIVQNLSRKYDVQVHTFIASTMDPTQILGLPYPSKEQKKTIEWYPDKEFVQENKAANHVYFFDELNMAPPSTQAAFYRLILEGKVGNIDISNALRIGAGNRIGDYENVQRMGLPMATRFQIYLIRPDLEEWLNWAAEHDLNDYILYYLNQVWSQTKGNGDPRWFCINPDSPSIARATPRSWTRLSKLLDMGMDYKEDIIGSLGTIPGTNFYSWYELAKDVVTKNVGYKSKKNYYGNKW
jgi:hypothetical protein